MAERGKIIRFPGRRGQHPGPGRTDERDFVEVRRCRDQGEALVVKSLFESEGILCLLRTFLAQSVHPFSVGDQGQVIVLVPAADAPQARILLARISPGPSFP
jgi:hypothetical protein